MVDETEKPQSPEELELLRRARESFARDMAPLKNALAEEPPPPETIEGSIWSYPELTAGLTARRDGARQALEARGRPRFPSAEQLSAESVGSSVDLVYEQLAIQVQIAARQEAAERRMGRILIALTAALVIFTIVIAVLIGVLLVGGY